MVRPADQEMIAIEKIVCPSQFLKGGAALQGHRGSTRVCREAEEQEENMGMSLYCDFFRKEQAR